jgi:hypothetical protein
MNAGADQSNSLKSLARVAFAGRAVILGALGLATAGLILGCAASGGSGNDGTGGVGGVGSPGMGGGPNGVGGSTQTSSGGATGQSTGGTQGGGAGGTGPAAAGGRTGAGGGAVIGVGGATGLGGAAGPMTEYWVGPTGSNANPGTQAAPFQTIVYAHALARPGVTIWILPGTYQFLQPIALSTNGTAANPVNLFAAPGARPVLDFSQQKAMPPNDNLRGFDIRADYWHLRGFEVKNANDNCIAISGSNNTIENVIVDFCGDTGLQITVPSAQASDATRGANNLILNCDSHDNYDAATGGENADGFAAKLDIGNGTVFRGCRSWNNSDDGYDLFGVPEVVTIDNCWAMLNGHLASGTKGPAADGNGFKLGGDKVPAVHKVTNSFAMTNDTCGFTLNSNTAQPQVTACGVNGNKTGTFCDGLTHSGDITITMTGANAITAARLTNVAAGASTLPPIMR